MSLRSRIEDIRLLKLEIKKLRREKTILQKRVSNVEDLRREVFHLQRELLRERTRCKALEEELENPMNIHRSRSVTSVYYLSSLTMLIQYNAATERIELQRRARRAQSHLKDFFNFKSFLMGL